MLFGSGCIKCGGKKMPGGRCVGFDVFYKNRHFFDDLLWVPTKSFVQELLRHCQLCSSGSKS
jgi:hypothetical protein